jgi:hypothetical protein
MCAEHSQEEIIVDFDLDTARKRKTITKFMTPNVIGYHAKFDCHLYE